MNVSIIVAFIALGGSILVSAASVITAIVANNKRNNKVYELSEEIRRMVGMDEDSLTIQHKNIEKKIPKSDDITQIKNHVSELRDDIKKQEAIQSVLSNKQIEAGEVVKAIAALNDEVKRLQYENVQQLQRVASLEKTNKILQNELDVYHESDKQQHLSLDDRIKIAKILHNAEQRGDKPKEQKRERSDDHELER